MVKAEAIQVCIRIRPPSALESAQDDAICCHKTGPDALSLTTVDDKANIECSYGTVLGQECGQAEVYEGIKGTVKGVSEGNNGCVFTYGQTGSGKTHTMLGSEPGKYDGIIVRAVTDLFENLATNKTEQQKGGDEVRSRSAALESLKYRRLACKNRICCDVTRSTKSEEK